MIATCPACHKRYRVPDEAVPPEGRSVRCTACGQGWIAHHERSVPDGVAPPLPFPDPASLAAAGPAPPVVASPASPPEPVVAALLVTVARPVAAPISTLPGTPARPRRRRWPWIGALLVLLAAGALAVVEFAPVTTFTPPRLGLPPFTLPMADLGSISLPKLTLPKLRVPTVDLPPLDLTRVPYVGASLDRLVNPPPLPASPLRLSVTSERHRLANGHTLLSVSGTLANPTEIPQAVPAIDAALLDPAGHAAFHWRIAPPVVELAPHQSVAIESVAANYPPDATVLRLRLKGR